MTIIEIAELLGIFYPTAQRHIRAMEMSGIAVGDYKMTCIVGGMNVHPEYYGIEMITALSFRGQVVEGGYVSVVTNGAGDTTNPEAPTADLSIRPDKKHPDEREHAS